MTYNYFVCWANVTIVTHEWLISKDIKKYHFYRIIMLDEIPKSF